MKHALTKKNNIYWLASYPKSGNTWVRAFIANIKREEPAPIDINELHTGMIASSRAWIEQAIDFDTSELSDDEIDRLRPIAYRWLSEQMDSPGYHKIHDANIPLSNGEPLVPISATRGALCIIRNPLDIAISFAHHNSNSIDKSIQQLSDKHFSLCNNPKHFHNQLRQKLLSWSEHVCSWVDAPRIKKLVVRYEDMKQNPIDTFSQMAEFLELPCDRILITDALEACKMEKLQSQEKQVLFKEKPAKAENFFRKGIIGDWQQTLTAEQVALIINEHREVMRRFGYLDDQGHPTSIIKYNQSNNTG